MYDIIILGSGLAGLLMASSLKDTGYKILIIDRIDEKVFSNLQSNSGRTIALSLGSKEWMDAIGIGNEIELNSAKIKDIVITNGFSKKFIHYDHKLVGDMPMGYNISSNLLKKIMYEFIASADNIDIKFSSTYKFVRSYHNKVDLSLSDGQVLSTKLLMVAEGSKSVMRDMCGFSCFRKEYNQAAMVFNVEHSKEHNGVAYEFFMPRGPFAFLPTFCNNKSSVIWTENTKVAETLCVLPNEKLESKMFNMFGDIFGDIKIDGDVRNYPINLIYSKEYHKGRVVLIGDALHSIHPVAGQGFNLSIRDIHSLSSKIREAEVLGLDIGDSNLLDRFMKNRRIDNKKMIFFTDFVTELFSNNSILLKNVRNFGIDIVQDSKHIKKYFVNNAIGKFCAK